MRSKTIILLFVILSTACSTLSNKNVKHLVSQEESQKNWKYFNLNHKIAGKIVAYQRASALCGAIETASSTIVKTSSNDTIRVIQLCNNSTGFMKSDSVEIIPDDKPSSYVLIFSGEYDTQISKTCYGIVSKIQ